MLCKRILFIIDSLTVGGAEKSLLSLLSLLDPKKYRVVLWIRYRGGKLEKLLPACVEILPEPKYTVIERFLYRSSLRLYSIHFRLLQLLKKKNHLAEVLWKCSGWAMKAPQDVFDVAIAYQQGLPTYLLVNKIQANKKIVWDNINMIGAGYDMKFNRQFYAKADHIVTVSKELQAIMQSVYPEFIEKICCIYDILSPALILQQAKNKIVDVFQHNGKTLIVTVGRMVPQKHYPLAVETAKVLRDRQVPFKWIFVGDGSERALVESLITNYGLQQDIILAGLQVNPYPYINQCDIYVQTSSFEGFGLTIAEAKILGKPVVSTNFDVVHDQLLHEHNGLIADMTAESVADNIIRLIRDDSLRQKIIENVKTETNTTAETEIKKVERLLDED